MRLSNFKNQICHLSLIIVYSLLFINCDGTTGNTSTFTLQGSSTSADASESAPVNFSVSPSSLFMKIYSLAVSTDEFCSDPITVFTNEEPVEEDLTQNPTLGSGDIPDGTYPCIIIEISDTFTYTPDATDGACEEGVEASKGVCNEGPLLLFDGTDGECTTGEDRVTIYLSTANTIVTPEDYDEAGCDDDTDCNGFVPPTAEIPTRGGALGAPLIISGDQSSTFVVDINNGLESVTDEEDNDLCSIEDIRFSFE
ncbi:hypothetical protein K1X76_04425 [bacterium]|nr:hypothetical protein [bacterium]